MPDPDGLCQCGHEYTLHQQGLFGWMCSGVVGGDYNKPCDCKDCIPIHFKLVGERWVA